MVHLPSLTSLIALAAAVQVAYSPRTDLEAGRYLKALAEAESRLASNPTEALALAAKSQALSSQLRFGEAGAYADRALAANSALADAHLARGLARAGTAVQQRNFSSLRSASGAMEDLRVATSLDPSLKPAWMSLGLAYQQLPGILGGSTRKALACADALSRVDAVKGDLLRGTILALDERWSAAEPFLLRAVAKAPADPQVVSGFLSALGERATRKSLGEDAQRQRLVSEAWRLLSPLRQSGRGVEAISLALLEGGQPEAAWKVALEALPTSDAPSLVKLQLGKVAARSGLHRLEGLAFLDQVLKEPLEGGSGGYAAAHWRRGQILKDLGRTAEARAAAQAALALDPKDPKAKKLLEEIPGG
jgi:tetratricopeptide (TPR) repeat protein